MSSSRVGHGEDKLLRIWLCISEYLRTSNCRRRYSNNVDISKILIVFICFFGYGLQNVNVTGLNVVKSNFNRSSSIISSSNNGDLDDLEPKTGLETRDLKKTENNINKSGESTKLLLSEPNESKIEAKGQHVVKHVYKSVNATSPHNISGIHGEHEYEYGHGHIAGKHETAQKIEHTNQAAFTPEIPKDPFNVEDILGKIFSEFEEEDSADNDQHLTKDDHDEDDADTIMGSRAEVDAISEKLEHGREALNGTLEKLVRRIRDDTESRQRNPPKNKFRPRPKSKPKRKSSSGSINRPAKQQTKEQSLAKYNEYMDAVLGRMNQLIKKKRMDPLKVNLYSGPSKGGNNKGNKNKSNNTRGGNQKYKRKNSPRMDIDDDTIVEGIPHEDEEVDENGPSIRNVNLNKEHIDRQMRSLLSNISEFSQSSQIQEDGLENPFAETDEPIVIDSIDTFEDEGRASGSRDFLNVSSKLNLRQNRTTTNFPRGTKGKKRKTNLPDASVGVSDTGAPGGKPIHPNQKLKEKNSSKNKNKKRNPNAPRPTRGILIGLSTLRRDGDVQVVRDGKKARIVRVKFLLGPVSLQILPKKGKRSGNSQESSSIVVNPLSIEPTAGAVTLTATAPQLKGVLEVRLSPSSPTRIRKLRVFPPGKVQVDGEKTDKSVEAGLRGSGYRKISPHATARLRQAAVTVVRQVDNKMKVH